MKPLNDLAAALPPPRRTREPARAEEKALVVAARGGDRRALTRLLTIVADPALRFGRSFCRHHHDAEEVMQDVMLSLARGIASFRGESALSTWAYQVARRACIRRRRRGAAKVEAAGARAPAEALRAMPSREPGPEGRYERRQLEENIGRAIASLPAPQREVLILRDVEGLPAAEVGRVLGLGERAVKSRLHRARLALRQALAPRLGRSAEAGERSRAVGYRRPRCPDTARLLSHYLEGELDAAQCAALAHHVEGCADCRGACEGLRAALRACRAYGERPVPAEVKTRVRAALRAVAARD